MLISGPELETPVFIDFRERAPAGAHKDMFVDHPEVQARPGQPNAAPTALTKPLARESPGWTDPQLATSGGLASGVPGELRGLEMAHGKYGKLPWADVFQPAIGETPAAARRTNGVCRTNHPHRFVWCHHTCDCRHGTERLPSHTVAGDAAQDDRGAVPDGSSVERGLCAARPAGPRR